MTTPTVGASLLAAALFAAASTARGQTVEQGLGAAQMMALAEQALGSGRAEDALTILDALTRDTDLEIRTEARFRKGMLLGELGRPREAAVVFRSLLDERPDAARVRLELARVLAMIGDEAAARRALRQVQAAGLNPDVQLVVDQFAAALRSRRQLGGSVQLAMLPDSNVNRATSARTLDTVIAPLTLSEDARRQSGLGTRLSGQGYSRVRLDESIAVLPRISTVSNLYGASEFNDISGSALIGLEWRRSGDRVAISAGPTWRWYGQRLYARTDTVAFDWVHAIGRRTQLTIAGSAAHARYRTNSLQTGGLFDASATLERAITPTSGLSTLVGATRQSARDPGYATWTGYTGLSGWIDLARTTLFAGVQLRRTHGDTRLALFPEARREWLKQGSVGATFRTLTVAGFAPLLRATYEHNSSTVGLYRYGRFAGEVGVVRAF